MADSFFDHGQSEAPSPEQESAPGREPAGPAGMPTEEQRMAAVMAYIPVICFVPLLKMRDDPYVYFHARQGLVLFFLEIVAFIFSFPHLSQLFWTVMIIACIGAAVAGAMFAMQGKMHKLPLIGDVAEKLKV